MNAIEQHLQKLEEQLLQAAFRKTPEKIAALLADEFIEIGKTGQIYNKQQVIESLAIEAPITQSLMDFRVLALAPDVVLVTYKISQQKLSETNSIYSLRSSIWKLMDNRWQLVFHQGTLLTV